MSTLSQRSTKFQTKISNGSHHSGCQSFLRCRLSFEAMYVFSTHFSSFIWFRDNLKRLFYHKVILNYIRQCFNRMMESTKTESVLSCFPILRNLWHFDFWSSLVQQLVQNGHMTMLATWSVVIWPSTVAIWTKTTMLMLSTETTI